jgi:RNA polymerase sigma-70 factor, ECF subfamily
MVFASILWRNRKVAAQQSSQRGTTAMHASGETAQAVIRPTKSFQGPDAGLVAAATGGDAASFEALVQRHWRRIIAVGRRMTGSLDDAEDIAQQTFMKAYINLAMFRGTCSFSTWLISIAINEARMWKRRSYRCREMSMLSVNTEDEQAQLIDVPDLRPDPESSCVTKERGELLFSRLRQLQPANRRALELCDLEEESTATTAFLLGITVSAVKSRRSRGRAALRRSLAPQLSPQ